MTKQEIINSLKGALNSPTWNNLKSAFLGKELIEYGATVIELSQLQKASLRESLNIDTCSLEELPTIAEIREVSYDIVRPSWVKIALDTPVYTRPFKLIASESSNYYNISDTKTDVVTLVQGQLMEFINADTLVGVESVLAAIPQFVDIDSSTVYFKLGKEALKDSVRVYMKNSLGNLVVLSEYDILNSGPDSNCFKLIRGYDGSLNVHFGDGVWGKGYDSGLSYQINWVNGTALDVYSDSMQVRKDGEIQNYTLVATGKGKATDLAYSKAQIKDQINKRATLATQDQIESAVRAYPEVIDCRAYRSGVNQVTVSIKSNAPYGTSFDFIVDKLNHRGEMVTDYKAITAVPVRYLIKLKPTASIPLSSRENIEDIIATSLEYINTPYNNGVNSATVLNLVSSVVSRGLVVTLQYQETLVIKDNVLLPSLSPMRGTLSVEGGSGKTAWDKEGYLYGAFTEAFAHYVKLYKIGDFYINTADAEGYDIQRKYKAVVAGLSELQGALDLIVSGNSFVTIYPTETKEFHITDVFTNGENSIIENISTNLLPNRVAGSWNVIGKYVYVPDMGFMSVVPSGGSNFLMKYTFDSLSVPVPNFSQRVTPPNWNVTHVVKIGEGLLVIGDLGVTWVDSLMNPTNYQVLNYSALVGSGLKLDSIVKIAYDKSLVIITQEQLQGTWVTKTWTASSVSVVAGSLLVSPILREVQSLSGAQVSVQILNAGVTPTTVIGGVLYENGVAKLTSGEPYLLVTKLGTVDFKNKKVTFDNIAQLANVDVTYASEEELSQLADNQIPVWGGTVWE